MNFCKIITSTACGLLLSMNLVFAGNKVSAEFFVSNNTKEINLEKAYTRLTEKKQSDLKNNILIVMQKNHIEHGKFEDILGTYRMSTDKNITADNTEHLIISTHIKLTNEQIFSFAKELAIKLKQDSVAVFIPTQSSFGD